MVATMKMASSSPRSPDRSAIQRVATTSLQSKSASVETLDGYLFRTYRLKTCDSFFYILRCRPPANVRLLRHEESWLESEAGTLNALGGRTDTYMPRLITYHTSTLHIGSAYLISGPFSGSILAHIEPNLSPQALANIDKSLGQYVRRLSSIAGPTFGFIREAQDVPCFQSWARAFAFLLESVIRDGEDAMISLPYEGWYHYSNPDFNN